MKRALVLLALLGLLAPAAAQVNVVPQTGYTTDYLRKSTYSAAFFGLTPAASATDFLCISGSTTKTVRIQNIKLTGTAGTKVTTPIVLLSRVSLDTGGTAATTTANPANTIAKRLTTDPTASAVPISYTANPTLVDTSPTYLDAQNMFFGVSGTDATSVPLVFDFGKDNEDLIREPTILQGVTRQICANLNAVSVSTGSISGSITWTEE